MNNKLMIGEFYIQKDSKRFKFEKISCLKGQKIHNISLSDKDFISIGENYKGERNVLKIQQSGQSENKQEITKKYYANQILYQKNFEVIIDSNHIVYLKGHKKPGFLGKGSLSKLEQFESVFENKKFSILKVVAGINHFMLLQENGDVYVWGNGNYGQLGLEHKKLATKPTYNPFFENLEKQKKEENKENNNIQKNQSQYQKYIDILKDKQDKEIVVDIFASGDHSFVLTNKNRCFGWGSNLYGQLGLKKPSKITTPIQIFQNKEILQLATCETHTFILTKDNKLYVSGTNTYGQIGKPENLKLFGFQELQFDDENTKIMQVQTTQYYTIALDDKSQLFFWGKNIYNEKITKKPTLIDLQNSNVPKINSIFVTKQFFLLYCPIQFHDVQPRNMVFESNLICKIKGYGLGKFSRVQYIKFEVQNLNLGNGQIQKNSELQDSSDEDSFEIEESKMFDNNVDFKQTKSKNAIKIPESELVFNKQEETLQFQMNWFKVLFNSWQSFQVRMFVNLDELNWIDTQLDLEIYDEKYIVIQDYYPKNYCVNDKQNFNIVFKNLANLSQKSLENSKIGFQTQEQEYKVDCYLKNLVATCEMPQFEISNYTQCQIRFYPNGLQNVVQNDLNINLYTISDVSISPNIRTQDGELKHYVFAKGLYNSSTKQVQLKYKDEVLQQELILENDQYYFLTKDLNLFQYTQESNSQANQDIDSKSQKSIKEIQQIEQQQCFQQQDIEISITLCGQYWIPIGSLNFSKIEISRVLIADPQGKKETEEEYTQRILQKEKFECIPEDIPQKGHEKYIKDLQKKKADREKVIKTQFLQNNQFVEVEGINFLITEPLKVNLYYTKEEKTVKEIQVEAFIKNSQNFVFKCPEILQDNFEVYDLKIEFTQNDKQHHTYEDTIKIITDQKELDEPLLSKERAKFAKTIFKQQKIN